MRIDAQHVLLHICFSLRLISRVPGLATVKEFQNDEYGKSHATGYHSTGRIFLNLWRLLRGELTLGIYTFENCAHAVLQKRVPLVNHVNLASWFNGGPTGQCETPEHALRRKMCTPL